jgi:hypothetical protein
MITLSDFGPNCKEISDSSESRQRYEPLQTGLSVQAAWDYCRHNLQTHPDERLWFWQPEPGSGVCVVGREVTN